MRDLSTKVTGSTLTAAEFVEFVSEMQKIITNAGITLDTADVNQAAKALSTQIPAVAFMTATGTMPTKVLTAVASHQPVEALTDGMELRFRSSDANVATGCTINVDTLGAKDVLKENGEPLSINDIIATRDAHVRYDTSSGGRFLLLNPQNSDNLRKGDIHGGFMTYIDAGGGVYNDLSITGCECRSADDTLTGRTTVTFTKQFDVNFAFGSGTAGGWGGGSRFVGETVYFFMIMKKDGTVDYGWDDVTNAANLLAAAVVLDGVDWVGYRLMAPSLVHSVGNTKLTPFLHDPYDHSHFMTVLYEGNSVSPASTAQQSTSTASDSIPISVMLEVVAKLRHSSDAAIHHAVLGDDSLTLALPTLTSAQVSCDQTNVSGGTRLLVPLTSLAKFAYRLSNSSGNLALSLIYVGFYFNRKGG